jgi:hypothetical protein
MNRNDEHLIFQELELFDGYLAYPNKVGFVDSYTHSDLTIGLKGHKNWPEIKRQPPVLVYDCPTFASQSDLMDYFCCGTDSVAEQDQICLAFDGNEKLQLDHQSRDYRLVLYSAKDPTKPIAFACFDLSLSEDIEQSEVNCDVNLITLKCDFLYAYVIVPYRQLGIGGVLGLSMGNLYWEQIKHVWSQINDSETALIPLIYSQQFSRGGKEIIKAVLREIKTFSSDSVNSGRVNHLRLPRIVT